MPEKLIIEVTRGSRVESRHRVHAAVMDADGTVVLAAGDTDAPVYPRSAVKGIQALPLIESGAADRFGLSDAELALACSSHSGEPAHVRAASSMLAKAGRGAAALECGAHWPSRDSAARALAAAGGRAGALHNNCSGKHAGFVCTACAMGVDPQGYVTPDHPTMRVVTAALEQVTGTRLDQAPGTDGCSIPTHAIALRAIAHGFARFATGAGLPPDRARAAARLRAAVAAHPFMVGGTHRFDTVLMQATGKAVFAKGGAEGVHIAALPAQGIGIAVKAEDGAGRAGEVALAELVARHVNTVPEALRRPALRNWNGIVVGGLRLAGSG
jgi:L-asparaginase II